MAFVGNSARGRAAWDEIAARSGFDHARIDADEAFGVLHALVLKEEGEASMSPDAGRASGVPGAEAGDAVRAPFAGAPTPAREAVRFAEIRADLG